MLASSLIFPALFSAAALHDPLFKIILIYRILGLGAASRSILSPLKVLFVKPRD